MALLKRFFFLFIPVFLVAQPDSSLQINIDVLDAGDLNPALLDQATTITSASRLPQDIRDIPYTGYVITHEQIRRRGYNTLVDVLKDLPGIKVSQPGSALHGETFLLRGLFGNYYVKILIDDLPIQPSATGGMPVGAQLPVAQAERIEVLYGPAAAIYGADAMAGVINIVTKKANKLHFIDVDLAMRIPGHYKFDATVTGKFARKNRVWNFMAYGGVYQFDNLPITGGKYEATYNPSRYVPEGADSLFLNSPLYRGTANQPLFSSLPDQSQKFGLRFGNKTISFGFDYGRRATHSAIGSNPLYKTYHDPNATFGEQVIRSFISYKGNWKKWYAQTNLQFLWYEINTASNYKSLDNAYSIPGEFYNYGASSDLYFEQFISRSFGQKWNVLFGATAQLSGNLPQVDLYSEPFDPSLYVPFSTRAPEGFDVLETFGVGPFNFYNFGGVAELDYQTDRLTLLVGVRADLREFFGFALSPRVGMVYKTSEKSRLRFTASTAFRPPSSYLINSGARLMPIDSGGTLITVFGLPSPNRDLSAENLFNIGAGWLWEISENHSLDVSTFYHYNSNLISRTTTSFFGLEGYYGFVNDDNSSAWLWGAQVVDRYRFRIGGLQATSDASIQYAIGKEVLPFERGVLNRFRGQPSFTGKWLLEIEPWPFFYVGVRLHVMSDWVTRSVILQELENTFRSDGFYLIDLDFRYSFDENKEVFFQIKNVTNNYYYGIGASGGAGVFDNRVIFEDLLFNPQMLRYLRLGVRISI